MATKAGNYTTQQTGAALWTPAAGKKILVFAYDIQVSGTTAGTIQLWWGASGDTTFNQGTDKELTFFDPGTPSATTAPGKVLAFTQFPAGQVNYILRVTTSAAVTCRIIVHGEEA